MSKANLSAPESLSILVIDDDAIFVETLVDGFERRSVQASGISKPADLMRAPRSARRLSEVDMVFLDMRLGVDHHSGLPISAADVLLHGMSYSPTAKVIVFTQEDISVEECARCIKLGALGVIPKTSNLKDLVLVAEAYRRVGDQYSAIEERIRALWGRLSAGTSPSTKGPDLEMLTINLFNATSGLKVIDFNTERQSGEIDVVIENGCDHAFWKELKSFHLIAECKNESTSSEVKYFNVLKQKVENKTLCSVGIMVAWSGVSKGFKALQQSGSGVNGVKIFALDQADLQQLVKKSSEERESYIRDVFSRQL